MTSLADATRKLVTGFSTPFDDWDPGIVEAWLILRARQRAGALADDLRRRRSVDPRLASAIEDATDRLDRLHHYWHPATGVVLKHRRVGFRSEKEAAELALFWHEWGIPGAWQLSDAPGEGQARSRFAGYDLGAPVVSFESDGGRALIETTDGRLLQFRRSGTAWTCDGLTRTRWPCGGSLGIEFWPLRSRCDEQDGGIDPDRAYVAKIRDALALLDRQSPAHCDWVRRLAVTVTPLERQGRTIRSWSSGDYPGLVCLCGNGELVEVAETLVHEASHQHFHALRQFGDLVDPSSDEMAFSPVKSCPRPIEMILLSYHAFANVQLYFRHLAAAGLVAADWYVSHCATLLEWRPILEGALRESRSVTPLGHLLWRTLSDRLDEDR